MMKILVNKSYDLVLQPLS